MNKYKSKQNWINNDPLTIVDLGSLHFFLEYRSVEICGKEIELTAKEFDILALLILNPRRYMIEIFNCMNKTNDSIG